MKIALTFFLLFATYTCSADSAPQSSDLVGGWKIEANFENHGQRSLRFDAEEGGKGTLLLEGARSNWDEPAKPTRAKWVVGSDKSVTISGPVEFPIGNVGRERGTLIFTGTFESESSIRGELKFFSTDQDSNDPKATPSRTGMFKATRVASK